VADTPSIASVLSGDDAWHVETGDCLAVLRTMPDACVQCVVTSPPYFSLRDYGVDGQIGNEDTLEEYIAKLVAVFAVVRRVLRDDGTLFLNLGDAYAGGGRNSGNKLERTTAKQRSNISSMAAGPARVPAGLKPKDLCMVPARVAMALQADGWWLRQQIVWHKPNAMPGSQRDRPTSSHEFVYLMSKSLRYFYDDVAVQESSIMRPQRRLTPRCENPDTKYSGFPAHRRPEGGTGGGMRTLRDVWSIPTQPFPGAHFAVMPERVAETCLKAGTSERGCCPTCGAPWERVVRREPNPDGILGGQHREPVRDGALGPRDRDYAKEKEGFPSATIGWLPTCSCYGKVKREPTRRQKQYRTAEGVDEEAYQAGWESWWETMEFNFPETLPRKPSVVLDPFCGAGTTGLVALRLGHKFVGIELNPEYVEMATKQILEHAPPEEVDW